MPKKSDESGLLVTAAKAVGRTAGKIAAMVGATPDEAAAPKRRAAGRLPKKNKSRLPRRQKKAQRKMAA